jgi:peroxiredoxin
MKRIVLLMISVLVAGVAIWTMTGCEKYDPVSQVLDLTQSAPMAPDFQLPDLNGVEVSLSSQRGKVVLLNFWATWCPPCREEMPSMQRLVKTLEDEPFVLLAVNVEADGPQTVPPIIAQGAYSFPVLFDQDGHVRKSYGVAKYPETFVIDADGVVVEKVVGGIDWSQPQVVSYLRALIQRSAEVDAGQRF